MVVKGTAPEEPRAQMKRLRRKKTLKTRAGRAEGVRMKSCFHLVPEKDL